MAIELWWVRPNCCWRLGPKQVVILSAAKNLGRVATQARFFAALRMTFVPQRRKPGRRETMPGRQRQAGSPRTTGGRRGRLLQRGESRRECFAASRRRRSGGIRQLIRRAAAGREDADVPVEIKATGLNRCWGAEPWVASIKPQLLDDFPVAIKVMVANTAANDRARRRFLKESTWSES